MRSVKARSHRRSDTEGRARFIVGACAGGVKDQIKFGGNTVDTSKQKPDLMSSNRPAADSGKRILANLEHGPRPAAKAPRTTGWTIDGWTIGLGLLLATMCTVAWLMHEKTITPSSFTRSRDSASPRISAERRQTEPDVAAVVQAEQPAAIVNEVVARPASACSTVAHAHAACHRAGEVRGAAHNLHVAQADHSNQRHRGRRRESASDGGRAPSPPLRRQAATPTSPCSPRWSPTRPSRPPCCPSAAATWSSVRKATAPRNCWRAASSWG